MLTEKQILERTSPDKLVDIYYLTLEGKKELVLEFDDGDITTLDEKDIEKLKKIIN